MQHYQHPPPASKPVGNTAWGPNRGLLVVAGALALAGLTYLLYPEDASPDLPTQPAAAPMAATRQPAMAVHETSVWRLQEKVPTWKSSPQAPASAEAEHGSDPSQDLSHYVPRGAKPTMNEVIQRLHEAGVHTGIGAFNPPGTRPPMVGLAVPEDYPLPAGYVRHYQATDDGQRIEPILMFAPDFQLVDAQKRPIDMPKNRVVSAELAPPGFPIRLIALPAPLAAPQ